MKHLIVLAALTFIVAAPEAHALFGRTAAERERRIETEQKLVQQQQATIEQQRANGQLVHTNQGLHGVIHVLSAGVVIALIIGAAIGSKTKRDARQP
jgi:lipid-binding SYLF domain-containing protein